MWWDGHPTSVSDSRKAEQVQREVFLGNHGYKKAGREGRAQEGLLAWETLRGAGGLPGFISLYRESQYCEIIESDPASSEAVTKEY